MPPLHVSVTGYAIVGLTQLILALLIVDSMLRIAAKSTASWLLTGFFAGVAASGVVTLLTNGLIFWNRLFVVWQDAFVLLGGVALAQFAYRFPRFDQPREARSVLVLTGVLALLAVAYGLAFDYQYIFQWSPAVTVDDAVYVLLPVGTLLIIIIFLRRSVHFSALAWAEREDRTRQLPAAWQRLLHPIGREAQTLRSFALALLLGFLPGFASLISVPDPWGFLMANIGSLLALGAIALVYFNYTPELNSFMEKLVGVTLVTVLLIFSVIGSFDYHHYAAEYDAQKLEDTAHAEELLAADRAIGIPTQVAYIVSWSASAPAERAAFRTLYVRPDVTAFDADSLWAQNQQDAVRLSTSSIGRSLAQITDTPWQRVLRYGTYPFGSSQPDFDAYRFTQDNTVFEIGWLVADKDVYLNTVAVRWIVLLLLSSLFVLAFFPIFFRRMLVNPLARLLEGISQVMQGDLGTTVPIQYHDEIGSLTGAFNALTRTLKESYDTLEQRVTDRTRELAAFSDMTMLPVDNPDLNDMLQPALQRILEASKCNALSLHVLSDDERSLQLMAHLYLPESAIRESREVALTAAFGDRVQHMDALLITGRLTPPMELPPAFLIPQFDTYLGCPLVAGEHSLGWMSCYRLGETEFGMSEVSFLVALARQLGVIVENYRLRQQISQIAVDDERQRLARELHDAVTQALYSQLLFARAGREALEKNNPQQLPDFLQHLETGAAQALKEMRLLLYQLRPAALQHGRLSDAIHERFDLVERRLGIHTVCAMDDVVLAADMEDTLYRVSLEALNNALKHADADAVQVYLCRDQTNVYLSIQDDGRGFAAEQTQAGMGFTTMRERVADLSGQLEIVSQPGQGTEVKVKLPLPPSAY